MTINQIFTTRMLESLEQANIKRMSVEKPEQKQELFFDPKKDITEDEWLRIQEYIKTLSSPEDYAAKVKLLDPDHLPELQSALSEEKAIKHVNSYKEAVDSGDRELIPNLVYSSMNAKLLWPHLASEICSGPVWKRVDKYIDDILRYEINSVGTIVGYKLLFPEKSPKGPGYRQDMLEAIEELHELDVVETASDLGYYRILFPDTSSPITLTSEDGEKIKNYLHDKFKSEDNSIKQGLHLAFYSMVAQAKKVEITEKGLKLNFAEEKIQEEDLIPEQRQF